ncbi:MAG: MBL fold metallo-hydrolase [Alphaproteobacteria bacterium]
MTGPRDFQVRFWGVRGSIACPGPDTVRYGGNTACVEMRCGDRLIVLDAGTGLRPLGLDLMRRGGPVDADLLISHTHFDHICGLPFFVPFFVPGNRIRLRAGHLTPPMTLRRVIVEMMMAPLFPVPPDIFRADVGYEDFRVGATLDLGDGIRVRTQPLNHPNDATAFRIEYAGRAACYVTDTEHTENSPDPGLVDFVRGADLVIYDSAYTDAEFPRFRGFGHSTWEEGVRIAAAAEVKTLAIFHHDPSHDDAFMDGVAEAARAACAGTLVAREGMILQL